MALSDTSKILISIKKLVGKSHTSNDKDVANESLPTGLTVSSNTIFGQTVPSHTGSASKYHVLSNSAGEGVAEFLRLSASFVVGSDTSSGRHGFSLKLPDNYDSLSKNPKKGTDPFTNGRVIYLTTGSLQLIPSSYDSDYEATPYHTGSGETQIPVLDSRDWSLDYFNGIFFQQDPPGTGDNTSNPRYVDAYLYIGKMTSEVIASGSNENVFNTISVSGQSDVIADTTSDTLNLVGAGGTTITTVAGTDTITISSEASTTGSFHVPSPSEFVTTASVSFAGSKGFLYTADSVGTDVNFFVSGAIGSKDSSTAGAAVFSGDVAVSGSFIASLGLSGSLTRLTDGKSYIASGDGITIQSASNGQITISSKPHAARFKKYLNVTASHASNNNLYVSEIDFSLGGFSSNYIDVFINGQLMLSGTQTEVSNNSVDYTLAVNKINALRFAFALDIDDIIAATVFQSGSS